LTARRALPFLTLAFLSVSQLGMTCFWGPLAVPFIAAPTGVVDDLSFEVHIQLWPNTFDPLTLEVDINGTPVVMSGGPFDFTATVGPGGNLMASNVVTASATRLLDSVTSAYSMTFEYEPPAARAYRITDESQLIEGPLASGRVGDYMIENDEARFIIQDVGGRDFYGIGPFGGNIIDAELVGRPGLDNFLEMTPMVNLETVVNGQELQIRGSSAADSVCRTVSMTTTRRSGSARTTSSPRTRPT